jgi:hypothetical protein
MKPHQTGTEGRETKQCYDNESDGPGVTAAKVQAMICFCFLKIF